MNLMQLLKFICLSLMLVQTFAFAEKKNVTVSPKLYKQLKKSEDLIDRGKYKNAEQVLSKALTETKKGTYSEATILRSLASIYTLQEKYKKALELLSNCLALKVLPDDQQQQGLLNLGQLLIANGQYLKAVQTLEPWISNNPKPDAQIYILMANAYAQLKKYKQALPYVEKAIQITNKPKQDWYRLQLVLYYELHNYQGAAGVLQKLIKLFPDKKEYWNQLTAIYLQLKKYNKAVSVKNLAYQKGFLNTNQELLGLVNLFLYVDVPYKSARILDKEISRGRIKGSSKNWELLAAAWTQAKEYKLAVKALRKASDMDPKGELFMQLGRIYVEQEQWLEGIHALNMAITKGGLKQTGNAYILLGMSYYESRKMKLSMTAFEKAMVFKKTRKPAERWLKYLAQENI